MKNHVGGKMKYAIDIFHGQILFFTFGMGEESFQGQFSSENKDWHTFLILQCFVGVLNQHKMTILGKMQWLYQQKPFVAFKLPFIHSSHM